MHRRRTTLAAVAALVLLPATDSAAIEMFTFFGDGSRVGLPSLEVPVEAYPGIPLRSDRIRARRRTDRPVQAGAPGRQANLAAGVTLRAVPTPVAPAPAARQAPMPPEPDDILPRPVRPKPAGVSRPTAP